MVDVEGQQEFTRIIIVAGDITTPVFGPLSPGQPACNGTADRVVSLWSNH